MNETSQAPSCSRCGAPPSSDALKGLCPRCLMALNLAAPTEIPGETGPHGTKVVKPPPALDEIAKHFPQFEILECLGRGGMGVVYKARQPKLNRIVALKILAPEKVAEPKFAERFEREAQALARLNHPNIVTVYDFGEADGLYYLTMEFVDGVSLRQLLQTRKIAPEEALAIVPKICEALQFAHEQGVVHRDIKPENVLLDKRGRVKIADFGIAKIVGEAGRAGSPLPADATQPEGGAHGVTRPTTALTQDQVLGTPNYMAPEQVEHPQTVDHRADIYSLGVVFYEMLTGELPGKPIEPPSRKVQIDVRLDEVVLRALEKNPELRFQQASEVKTCVETIASTVASPPAASSPQPVLRDSMRFTTSFLPNLLPGERVLHVKRLVWAMFIKSLPNYRLFFSLPPLWEAGMYVTDRRVLHVWSFFRLLALEFSVWFSGKAREGRTELFKEVSTGKSRCFGEFLDIKSETPRKRWYRSHEMLLRIYTREAGALQRIIASASDAGSSRRQEAQTESVGDGASPGRSASAATTGKQPWASFCLAITFAGALLIGSLCELLFRHVSGGWLIGIFIFLACASAMLAFVLESFATAATHRVCFKAGAWLAFIAPLPLFGLGVFFLNALLSEHGGWHPNPAEAVIVPLVWLGALLLPVCGWRLLCAAGQPLGDAWIIFSIIVAVVMIGLDIPVVYYWTSNRQHKEQQYEKEVAREIALALPQLRSEDVERRRSAAMDLFSLGTGAKGAVPQLLRALEDSDGLVRMFAASALGHIGTNAGPAAASALSRALADPDQRVRFSAAVALGSVDLQTTANLAVLMDRLTNRPSEYDAAWPKERQEAVTALGKMGARAAPALPVLRAAERQFVERDLDVKSAIEQIEQAGKKSKRGFFGLFQSESSQPETAATASRRDAVFGPEKEVTLTEINNRDGQEALDLDTGTVFKQPKDMDQWLEAGMVQWVKEHGVDLFVDHGPGGEWGLLTTTNAELKLARVENDKRGAISAGDLVRVLDNNSTPLQIVTQGRMKVYLPPKETQPPMTFAFKTSTGGVGILQITGYTDKPRGVKIRYKLVSPKPAASIRDPASELTLNDVDNPVFEVTLNDVGEFLGSDLLDLDSGRLMELPADLRLSASEQAQRLINTHGGLFAGFEDNRWFLATALGNELKLRPLMFKNWEMITLSDISQALASKPTNIETKQTDFIKCYFLATNVEPPLNFAFQTGSGNSGQMQITGFNQHPRGLKIRHKLVRTQAATQSPAEAARDVVMIHPATNGTAALNAARDFVLEHKWKLLSEGGSDERVTMRALDAGGKWVTFEEATETGGMARFTVSTEPGAQIPAHRIRSELWHRLGWGNLAGSSRSGGTNTPSFGPVIERVVSGEGDANQRFIDLDTGKLYAAAEFFGAKAEPSPEQAQQWWRRTGIDAVGDTSAAVRGLVGFEMVATPVPAEEWERMIPARLEYYFVVPEKRKVT